MDKKDIIDFIKKYDKERPNNPYYTVVFLIHHLHAWYALKGLWQAMYLDEKFKPVVLSLPHRFVLDGPYYGEEDVHNYLTEESVPHIRFPYVEEDDICRELFKIHPDILIRQSPWAADIPAPYSLFIIGSIRGIHTEYACSPIEESPYRKTNMFEWAWILLCANEDQKKCWLEENPKLERIFVTGYPKFEMLQKDISQIKEPWPIQPKQRPYRILWTAHHSIDASLTYGFAVFPKIYKDMIAFAKENKDCEIVFRPHPALLEHHPPPACPNLKEILKEFFEQWEKLPNTSVSLEGTYTPLFAASDCLFTDGISFLQEYQMARKPVVFFESDFHTPFNRLGKETLKACYVVHTFEKAKETLFYLKLAHKNHWRDHLITEREHLYNYLLPFKGHTIERCLDIIKREMSPEKWDDYYEFLDRAIDL